MDMILLHFRITIYEKKSTPHHVWNPNPNSHDQQSQSNIKRIHQVTQFYGKGTTQHQLDQFYGIGMMKLSWVSIIWNLRVDQVDDVF